MKRSLVPRLYWAGFLFTFALVSCLSPPPSGPAVSGEEALRKLMSTVPERGKLVFLGTAGIRSNPRDSLGLALLDAARRAAIFDEVEGEFSVWSNKGGRLLDYRAESASSLRYDVDYAKYLDALEFDEDKDVFRSENAVFVRVRYPGSLDINYLLSRPAPGKKPWWVENPPAAIGGYAAGVGYAGRRNAYRDTVTASYENAVFAIIRALYTVSWGESFDYRGAGFLDTAFTASGGLSARGRLKGFYALETWTDPADKSVWTLAVAKDGR